MKRNLLVSALLLLGFVSLKCNAQVYLDPNAPVEDRVKDALSRMTVHEKVLIIHAQSGFTSAGVPRLGIRQLNMSDGPHGAREELDWNSWRPARWTNDSIVAFPSLTCLAATWNTDMSRIYGSAVSEEFAFRGKDMMLGPGVNINRVPLNGRNFEYMGEDPYLAGEMVVPYIQAVQKNGVATCIKHFFLNNQEMWRSDVNVNVSERAVEEIYLPAFEAAVKRAGTWSIMGSYNKWLDRHCCQNDSSLNSILKRRWGFDGVVVSDWGGTHSTEEAAFGGLDIEMGSAKSYNAYYLADDFEQMVKEGKVPMSILDDKAARVLRTMFRTCMNPRKIIGNIGSEAHYDACRNIGEEGIVLLKNEKSILPLQADNYRKILVVGDNATRNMSYGGGSSELKTRFDISPLDGLRKVYGDKIVYVQGYTTGRPASGSADGAGDDEQARLKTEALEAAKDADLVIFIGGMNKSRHQDCEGTDREGYELNYGQNDLITQLAKVQKNLIVVTFSGSPFATPWIKDVRAMLHCWYLGSMSGETLANVISGKVNPSGKLPVTFAKRQEDYPCFQYGPEGYPGIEKRVDDKVTHQVYYKEGIYVGYRHFNTNKVEPQFPFGFGLSYTTFRYGKASATANADGTWTVSVPVTNTGKVFGKEVVELYISDDECSVDRPAKELKGFTKLALSPGETKDATFTVTRRDLSFFDEATHAWKAEPGTFTAHVAASETDVRSTVTLELR
ncbi:MAG: glycoside hydrolase family 3 C-terminal domain-containing protein [Bacteroidaceae bacterium]|nr:glycoside hydrolase family 3 C-terminal domain-containing protein [Bacteroidaceae bacterium]